ncbi:MAG TPA: hypothetical protein PK475_09895, partial [Rectinema sp.]|nr:hypothetical protein [Rectinema sp.]
MQNDIQWINNALGRKIPLNIDGRLNKPFQDVFSDATQEQRGRKIKERAVQPSAISQRQKPDKLVASWDELFERLD